MLDGEHFSGAPDAALHFIGDKQDAVLVADFSDDRKKLARRNNEAAFAENRLSNNGSDLVGGNDTLEGVLKVPRAGHVARGIGKAVGAVVAVGVRDAVDFRREWAEANLVGIRFAGQGHREQGAAVEGVLKANYCGTLGVGARNFDGVFDGFRTGIDEKGFLRATNGRERV